MEEDKKSEILKEFDPLNHLDPPTIAETDKDVVSKKDDNTQLTVKANAGISAQDMGDDEPFYDFQLFAKQLQSPGADPLVKYTKSVSTKFYGAKAFMDSH